MLDILIKNARIVDGTGNPWFRGDIGVFQGYIVTMDRHVDESAHLVIDADGRVASPGFIDIHSHDDLSFPRDPDNLSKLSQGVTTVVVGNCGFSMYPTVPETKSQSCAFLASLSKHVTEDDLFHQIHDYSSSLEKQGLTTNMASLAGHGAIRVAVMGYDPGPPSREQLSEMKRLLREAICGGAFGLSIGLIYAPGSFANTAELTELAKTAGECGGFLAAHIRTYGTCLLESIEELLEILKEARIPGQLSHLEAVGAENWGKVSQALALMEEARRLGIDITCDMYPYTVASTTLISLLPPWAQEGGIDNLSALLDDEEKRARIKHETLNGMSDKMWECKVNLVGWKNITVSSVSSAKYKAYEGKNFQELADELGKDPFDILTTLLVADRGKTLGLMSAFHPEDILAVFASPLHMVGSDGIWTCDGKPHPRQYGTFSKVLRHMVHDTGILTLEEAVRKMTSQPAGRLGLLGRGILKPGMAADIIIFSPDEVEDVATFDNPRGLSKGFSHVIVNGKLAFCDGKLQGERPGRFLKHGRPCLNSAR